jgi:hypothetical protein
MAPRRFENLDLVVPTTVPIRFEGGHLDDGNDHFLMDLPDVLVVPRAGDEAPAEYDLIVDEDGVVYRFREPHTSTERSEA